MAKKKSWEIESLKSTRSLVKTAKTILTERIYNLVDKIDIYFSDPTAENLHAVRIALRRVRYSMELFIICFDRKLFFRFYNRIQKLQDLSGFVRDLDVLLMNMDSLKKEEKVSVSDSIYKKVHENKFDLEENFRLELMKFMHSKVYKDFSKLL